MIEIVVHDRFGNKQTSHHDKQSVMIGRSGGNDVLIEADGVSRFHARLSLEGDELLVQDMESTNGTYVNSERVTSRTLLPGDRINIGDVFLTVKLVDSQPADLPPADYGLTPQPDVTDTISRQRGKIATAVLERPAQDSRYGDQSEDRIADGDELLGSGAGLQSGVTGAGREAKGALPIADDAASETERNLDAGKQNNEDFYWRSLAGFLGPIWHYIVDEAVSEVMINGPTEIYIERKGHLEHVDAKFTDDQIRAAVLNIAQYVGRRVSEEEPYMDARLPDGSRVAILMPPCSRKGVSLAIRKFSKEKLTVEKLMEFGSLSREMVEYLRAAVELKKNIIVSGGTSSGKTSLLNVISGLIPDDERIITIEDAAELQLRQEHVLPMETRPPDKKGRGQVSIRDLVRASLRLRPDRIVVGEIRGGEALDLLQAMNTGHSGSMATVHASSPTQALTRLETLSLFSGIEIPIRALREQVSTAIDVIVQASRLPDHSRKVTYISEVAQLDADGSYQVHDIFRFNTTGRTAGGKIEGRHVWTGNVTSALEEMRLAGMETAARLFETPATR